MRHVFFSLLAILLLDSCTSLFACDQQLLSKPAQPKEYDAKVRAFATMTCAHPKTIECLHQTLSTVLPTVLIDIVQQYLKMYPFLPTQSLPPTLCYEQSLNKKLPICYIFQPMDSYLSIDHMYTYLSITRMHMHKSSAKCVYPKAWDPEIQQRFAEIFTQKYGPCSPQEDLFHRGNPLIQLICGINPRVLSELAYLLNLRAQKIAIDSAPYEQGIYESPYMLYPDFTLHDFANQIQKVWLALKAKASKQRLTAVHQKFVTEFIQAYESSQFIQLALETQPGRESVLLSPKVKEG